MQALNPEVLIGENDIALRVEALGKAITQDFAGEEVTVVCILKGAFIFCSDLVRAIDLPVILDFMTVSSYGNSAQSSGQVKIELDLSDSVKGKNVIIVEDIVDTGLTVNTIIKLMRERGAKSVKLASLLHKPQKSQMADKIDYLGFEIEDKFVVGYGLDYAGKYRELSYIGVLNAGI